jgi:hypothetical protein
MRNTSVLIEERPLSPRSQTEIVQGQIRLQLRDIIDDLDGKWVNAQALAYLVRIKCPDIDGKAMGEYLKRMNLKTRTVRTTIYLCTKQFSD